MTNKEKYYDELIDYALMGIDIAMDKDTNKIASCAGCQCRRCKFYTSEMACSEEKLIWLNEEYIEPEPETDWSKVEVDTPILVNDEDNGLWKLRYFAKYKDGKVLCWNNGRTSYTVHELKSSLLTYWKCAKLPIPEELEQYRKKV